MVPRIPAIVMLSIVALVGWHIGAGVQRAGASHSMNHALYAVYPSVWVFDDAEFGIFEDVWRAEWDNWDNISDMTGFFDNQEWETCDLDFALFNLNDGDTGYAGLTIYDCVVWNSDLDRYDLLQGQAYINNYYSLSASQWEAVACHEIGHVIGLGHRSSGSSCMLADGQHAYGSGDAHDVEVVDSKY